MSPKAQGDLLNAIFNDLNLRDIHLVGPDVGMGAALAYVVHHEHRLLSMVVGNGPGTPGPFKLARMISMLGRFGVMRWLTSLLGAGPLIAFTAKLGAIRHTSNAVQIYDYKRAYSGRTADVLHWFEDLRLKAAGLAERVNEIDIPTLVFWGELEIMYDVSNAKYWDDALPHSKLQILPEAGHLAWSDQSDMFSSMITEWVRTEHKKIS